MNSQRCDKNRSFRKSSLRRKLYVAVKGLREAHLKLVLLSRHRTRCRNRGLHQPEQRKSNIITSVYTVTVLIAAMFVSFKNSSNFVNTAANSPIFMINTRKMYGLRGETVNSANLSGISWETGYEICIPLFVRLQKAAIFHSVVTFNEVTLV